MSALRLFGALAVIGPCLAIACGGSEEAAPPDLTSDDDGGGTSAQVDGSVPGPGSDGGGGSGHDAEAPTETSASGSRLRRVSIAPEGASDGQFIGFYDQVLGQDCTPTNVGDEARPDYRCTAPLLPPRMTSIVYLDAECTQVGVYDYANAFGTTGDECAKLARISGGIVSLTPTSNTVVYRKMSDRCAVDTLFHGGPAQPVYAVGPVSPSSAYAGLDLVAHEVAPNLSQQVWSSADGARAPSTYRVTSAQHACEPLPDRDGVVRCLPGPRVRRVGYSDSACTTPAVEIATGKPTTVRLASEGPACPPRNSVFGAGAPSNYTSLFALSTDGQCRRGSSSATPIAPIYTELEPSTFVAFDQTTVQASPRLTAVARGVGPRRDIAYYTDSSRGGAACRFLPTADGRYRCLPIEPQESERPRWFYTDASCTQPVRAVLADRLACSSPDVVTMFDADACPTTAHWSVYPLAPAESGGLYEARGSCRAVDPTLAVRRLGPALDLAQFAEGVRLVE